MDRSMPDVMRCLSVRQPFAWAICAGLKTIENRSWKTTFRGTIAIHAASNTRDVQRLRREAPVAGFHWDDLTYGAILGTAEIVEVDPYGPQHEANVDASGPYCFSLDHARLFATPIPLKGKLNLFALDPATTELVRSAETAKLDSTTDGQAGMWAAGMGTQSDLVHNYQLLVESFWDGEELSAVQLAADRLVELEPHNAYGYFVRYMFADLEHAGLAGLHDAQKIVELEPDSAMGHACVGWSLHLLGRNAEALPVLDFSLRLSQEIPRAWYSRAEVHYALSHFQASLEDCNRALHGEPDLAEALLVRGRCQLALGNPQAAVADADAALRLVPQSAEAMKLKKSIATLL